MTSPSFEDLIALKAKLIHDGSDIVDLSMINPDLDPPRILIDRLLEASNKMHNQRYAVSRGIRRAREGFAEKYTNRFGVSVEPEHEVCLTFGTKDALNLLMHVFAKRGGRVLLPEPTYPGFCYAAQYAGLEWDTYSLFQDEGEVLAGLRKKLQSGTGYAGVFLNFPNNPTGQTVSLSFYSALADLAHETGTYFINDFVYGEMGYGDSNPVSLLSASGFGEYGLETYSLSKAYSVPGWRVGALLGRSSIVKEVAKLKSQVDYGLYLPLQLASAAALSADSDLTRDITLTYARRAQTLSAILERHEWKVQKSVAGCCVWAELPTHLQENDTNFVKRALLSGVSATPGSRFGSTYANFIRFALVVTEERIRQLEERLFQ